jgi:hypothetical protein
MPQRKLDICTHSTRNNTYVMNTAYGCPRSVYHRKCWILPSSSLPCLISGPPILYRPIPTPPRVNLFQTQSTRFFRRSPLAHCPSSPIFYSPNPILVPFLLQPLRYPWRQFPSVSAYLIYSTPARCLTIVYPSSCFYFHHFKYIKSPYHITSHESHTYDIPSADTSPYPITIPHDLTIIAFWRSYSFSM